MVLANEGYHPSHPNQISFAKASILNTTPSTFSFQDALDITSLRSSTPYFFPDGCKRDDGSQNCTASCQDENAIFSSLDTLRNCMLYPSLADWYATGNLNNNTEEYDYYKIHKAKVNSDQYKNVTTTIQTCLMDYCTITLNTSRCKEDLYDKYSNADSPSNLTSSFYFYDGTASYFSTFSFCDYVPGSFNADIGGIGVYISYWIQTGLALLSFLLVIWWNWGIYYICLGALLLPRGYTKADKAARRIRNNSRSKHLPSLTGALAEFQKAQCFFMLAINIAALVNRRSGGFQPSNLQQLYDTYILIKSISISGYLPVTFTLFTLHLVDVVSWYLLVLSVVTVFVSTATLFVIGNFSPGQDDLKWLSKQASFGGPDSCGKKNLLVYCYEAIGEYESTDPASGAYSMLAFCLVVLILLVAHQYHAFKDPSTGQNKPWLSKLLNTVFRKHSLILRSVQVVLALICIGLNSYAVMWYPSGADGHHPVYDEYDGSEKSHLIGVYAFVLFASCWTTLFVLYLFLTSNIAYTHTDRPVGRFSNQKISLAVDCLSAVFWFVGCISLAASFQSIDYSEYGIWGAVSTGIIVAACLCIAFVATTVLAARHMHRTGNNLFDKHTDGKQYWISLLLNKYLSRDFLSWRRLIKKLPSWKQMSHKLPSWAKHPLIIDSYTRLQQNTLPSIKAHSRRAYRDVRTHASTLAWPRTLISATIFSLYLIFFGLYIHWFKIFIQDLAWFAYNGVDRHSWSFGQIVAISVWAEPLCEYFHLELRGMTRGFEHRLWGYTVVRTRQPNTERGVGSDSSSFVRHLSSSSTSLDCQDMGDYGKLGAVEIPDEGRPYREGEHAHQQKDNDSHFGDGDLAMRPLPESRDGSEEMDDQEDLGRWQIPETVLLTISLYGHEARIVSAVFNLGNLLSTVKEKGHADVQFMERQLHIEEYRDFGDVQGFWSFMEELIAAAWATPTSSRNLPGSQTPKERLSSSMTVMNTASNKFGFLRMALAVAALKCFLD